MKKILVASVLFCATLFGSCRSENKPESNSANNSAECPEITVDDLKKMDLSNLWIGAIPDLDRVDFDDIPPAHRNDKEWLEYIKEHKMITWFERGELLGYVGDDFTRFYIHFSAVSKDVDDPLCYHMSGRVRIDDMIRNFDGVLHVENVEKEDCTTRDVAGIWTGWSISGRYEFSEFEGDWWQHSGAGKKTLAVLGGRHFMYLCADAAGKLYYDTTSMCGDGYHNNQWEGTRRDSATGVQTVCNWGDSRIPNSEKFDIGAGEFSPADEYRENGWQSYCGRFNLDKNAVKRSFEEECRQWWILGI